MATPDEPRGDDPILSQEELDALLAAHATPSPVPAPGDDPTLIPQDELDALFTAPETGVDEADSVRAALDALLEQAPASPPPRGGLDALLAEEEAAPPPVESEMVEDAGHAENEVELDQATLDALMAEVGLEPPSIQDLTSNEVLGGTDMDAPVKVHDDSLVGSDTDAPVAPGAGEDDARVDTHPHDAVPGGPEEEPLGSGAAEADSGAVEAAIAPAAIDAENQAAAVEVPPVDLIDQEDLDALLADAMQEEAKPRPSTPSFSEELVEAPDFEPDDTHAAVSGEPVMDPDIEAAIDLEALVVNEVQPEFPPPADADSSTGPPPAAKTPKPPRRPRIRVRVPRVSGHALGAYFHKNALRLATAVSAGMVIAMTTFTILFTNQVRQPSPAELAELQQVTLEEAVRDAREHIVREEYSEALALLDPALAREPESPLRADALFLRMRALYEGFVSYTTERERLAFHGDVDAFELDYPADPRVAQALEWQAILYERSGDPYAARRNYRKIEANFPNFENRSGVLLASARLSLALNQPEDALAALESLMRNYPGAPSAGEARLLLADTYIARGERRRGRELLEGIARGQTHTGLGAAATARLARLAFEEGRFEEAIEMLEGRRRRATTVDGNDEVYLLLAHAYREAGDTSEAERVLRELIDFFPDTPLMPEAYLTLSDLLERGGRREEALRLARLALDRYDHEREVVLNAAGLLEKAGQPREAAELYLRAEAMEQSSGDLLLKAGRAFLGAEDPERALETLGAVVDSFPGTPEAIAAGIEWARASFRAGAVQPALARLRSLRDQTLDQPAQMPVLLTTAEIYESLGLRQPLAEVQREIAALTHEPQRIAEAAIAMIDAGHYEPGFAAASRVDLEGIRPATAYALLMGHAEALLRSDSAAALEKMERAYEDYSAARSAKGDRLLFTTYLTLEQPARARVLLADLEQQARRNPVLNEQVQDLAVTLGDYHYRRGDYRAALDVYAKVVDAPHADEQHRAWATFQRANALVRIREFDEAAAQYEAIIAERSEWANDAALRRGLLQLERRLRSGQPAAGAAR